MFFGIPDQTGQGEMKPVDIDREAAGAVFLRHSLCSKYTCVVTAHNTLY